MRSVFQTSERSRDLHVGERGEHLRQLALAVVQGFAGAKHRGIALHDALHLQADVGRAPRALGMAQPIQARHRGCRRHRLCSARCAVPGFTTRAQCRAASRPKTTRSSSELDPRRLAPCTDTQAASPTAMSPGTTASAPAVARDHLAVHIAGNAAHVVVNRGQHRDRLLGDIDSGEDARGLGDAGQPLLDDRRTQVLQMQIDVVLELADAAALANLDGHRAADHVARRQILGVRRIALHEALAAELVR